MTLESKLSNQAEKIRHNVSKDIRNFSLEIISIIGLLSLFLCVNLFTHSQFPTVWFDEVSFTDAAVNLYLGKGFTSSAWMHQTRNEFWAGNVPLYTIILYYWIEIFGFSILAVRSLNYKNVNKNDWVFADNSTYYAIERISDNIFKCHIGILKKLAERDRLTVLI